MAETLPALSSEFDDNLRANTSQAEIPTIEAPESILAADQLDGPSLASTLKLPESSGQFLYPIPVSKPQYAFSLSDLLDETGGGLETLGFDIASAGISFAPDGSFIRTSSGPAARELKRRYDQLAGVSPTVRSPYMVTAFVSQYGKSMYRIGHRELPAPAASAAEVEGRITQSKPSREASHSPRTKRRSRLSMNFLPPAMFTKSNMAAPTNRPPTATSSTSSVSRKLRKTRSIPDMSSSEPVIKTAPTFAVTGRGQSQSVTAVDSPRSSLSFNAYPATPQLDAFGELMDWFAPSSSASSNFLTNSLFNSGKVSSDPHRPEAEDEVLDGDLAVSTSQSTSQSGTAAGLAFGPTQTHRISISSKSESIYSYLSNQTTYSMASSRTASTDYGLYYRRLALSQETIDQQSFESDGDQSIRTWV